MTGVGPSPTRIRHPEEAVLPAPWSRSDRALPRRVVRPLQLLGATATAGAVVMMVGLLLALVLANSPLAGHYERFWSAPVTLEVGRWTGLSGHSLREWVNDAAMAVFFFLVSLEIKREMVDGELRDPRAAALPIAAAFGGMVVPALIYTAVNLGGPGQHGWGVPMATDIAFAVAVLTAVGDRVPAGARLFLLTLAIVDDLGAIVVIGVFYTQGVVASWIGLAVLTVLVALVLRRAHVRALAVYAALAILCWYALLQSGVHPTIAGVVFAFLTPARAFHPREPYLAWVRSLVHADSPEAHSLRELRRMTVEAESPLERLEWRLAPWVTFVVLPVFALANAGLPVDLATLRDLHQAPVALGIVLGLVLGKTVGILLAVWLVSRTPLAVLPTGVSWPQLASVAMCAGVGFTVALFVAGLAFTDAASADSARMGILVGSTLAAVLGYGALRATSRAPLPVEASAPSYPSY
ncbi:MAG TPA: Na+/H+ antiporter NhaA [Nocardioides sp.]|nr:Na+/H+ antiporter NhaA [Nocardioides sp.]